MSDLIINGIDHGKFYIEWAKRGGVVKTSVSEQPAMAKCLGVKQDGRALFVFFIDECENERWHYGFVYPKDQDSLRMATPDECAEAGVEYIEPPARWLPIENAPMHTDVIRSYYDGSMSIGWIFCDGEDSAGNDVRAWQPLPQPPKGE
jgi:hypothetical protein